MKQSNNNAVDLLLRSLARRERDESPASESDAFIAGRVGSEVASEHLDADELNLYAEGVLPAPARTRYAEHLADCGICRGMVVGLAQAAGTTARYETVSPQSRAGLWQSLATLFSLPVLRYALPALVLTGVIAIGLVALREQRSNELVASRQTADALAPAPGNEPAQSAVPEKGLSGTSPSTPLDKRAAPSANTESNELKNNQMEDRGLLAKTGDTIAGAKPGAAPAAKDGQEYPNVAGATSSQPFFAQEPAPPPKSVPTDADTKLSARKEESLEREAQKGQDLGYTVQSKDDSPTHGPARSRAPSAGGRLDTGLSAENRVSRDKAKKESDEETETRTVSGRRFRRQGNAWIDTAYESSRGTTNVARGSEQFRALIADEPGLRAIVQTLGGEVVVVWKNRAYRIR